MERPRRRSPIYFAILFAFVIGMFYAAHQLDTGEWEAGVRTVILKAVPFTVFLQLAALFALFLFGLIIMAIKWNEDTKIQEYNKKHPKKKRSLKFFKLRG